LAQVVFAISSYVRSSKNARFDTLTHKMR